MTTREAYVSGKGLLRVEATDDPTVAFVYSQNQDYPDRKYRIQGLGSASPSCPCPDNAFSDGDCKHILAAIQLYMEDHMSEPETTTALATRPASTSSLAARHGNTQSAQAMAIAARGQVEGYKEYLYLAESMWAGKLFPESIKTPQAAASVMMKAAELGVPPMTALELFYVVGNKVAIQGQMIGALIERSEKGYVEIVESTEERCTVRGHRNGRPTQELTWTQKDAVAAGSKPMGGWKDKLVWKATARIGRRMFADVLGGMDVADGNGVVVDYAIVPEAEGEYRAPQIEPTPEQPKKYAWMADYRTAVSASPNSAAARIVREYLQAELGFADQLDQEALKRVIDQHLERTGRTPHELVSNAVSWNDNGRPDITFDPDTTPEPIEEGEFREEPAAMDTLFDLPDPVAEPAQPGRMG